MTREHRRNIELAIKRSPNGRSGRRLESAFRYLQLTWYSKYVSLDPNRPDARPAVLHHDKVPSFRQFQYYWRTTQTLQQRLKKRLRPRGFEQLTKLLTTGTLNEVGGPGVRYYIDATVVDVYVVSRFNRNRIVGRPTFYAVVDQFSRMIVGMYVGLEPPCWAGAMLALWHCSQDKVAYCKRFDYEITEEIWPTGYMPVHLMGDRGELKSEQAQALVDAFILDIENARPYAGEAKGVVERDFGSLQAEFVDLIPGHVDKEFMGRDVPPAALSSALTLEELTGILVGSVLDHNLSVIRDYPGTPELIRNGVALAPVDIWNWGVKNLRYEGRQFAEQHLIRHLWPEAKLKMTKKGLQYYRGLYYMGADLKFQDWFQKILIEERTLSGRFNPSDIHSLYLVSDDVESGLIPIEPTRRSQKFAQYSLSEVYALANQKQVQNAASAAQVLPMQLSIEKNRLAIVKQAKAAALAQRDQSLSKTQRLKGIRANRSQEIDDMSAEALQGTFIPARDVRSDLEVDDDSSAQIAATHAILERRLKNAESLP